MASPTQCEPSAPQGGEALGKVLARIVRHPVQLLVAGWNWKAAAVSALLRATTFLLANLRAGSHKALRAMLVEACFAILAAGVLAAITQRLRWARPVWATGLIVWIGLPSVLVAAQAAVHHLARTPHLRTGLIASFCFAAIASGFNWFAQRRGVFLAGAVPEQRSLAADLSLVPAMLAEFMGQTLRSLLRLSQPRS